MFQAKNGTCSYHYHQLYTAWPAAQLMIRLSSMVFTYSMCGIIPPAPRAFATTPNTRPLPAFGGIYSMRLLAHALSWKYRGRITADISVDTDVLQAGAFRCCWCTSSSFRGVSPAFCAHEIGVNVTAGIDTATGQLRGRRYFHL